MRLRFARSVRISIDGNAHFCRGLLRTRYPQSAADQSARPEEFPAGGEPVGAGETVPAGELFRLSAPAKENVS